MPRFSLLEGRFLNHASQHPKSRSQFQVETVEILIAIGSAAKFPSYWFIIPHPAHNTVAEKYLIMATIPVLETLRHLKRSNPWDPLDQT